MNSNKCPWSNTAKKKEKGEGSKKIRGEESGNLLKWLRDPNFPKPALTGFVIFKKIRILEVKRD